MKEQFRLQMPGIKRRLRSQEAIRLFRDYDFIENIMKRSKSDYWKYQQLFGFATAFSDDFECPRTLGYLTVKNGEVHAKDDGTQIIDDEKKIIEGSIRPRAVIKVEGDETHIFFASLVNKMMKIIFPYSYIHSFTPEEMHDHFIKVFSELRDRGVIPENMD